MTEIDQTRPPILVAVAWPYASGPRHLGHAAAYVPADVFARYHRLKGSRVLMVSGTDEHGTPSLLAADKEGIKTRALVDRYNALIADDFRRLGFTYDAFTRTTTENHHRVAQDVFRVLHEKGFLTRKTLPGAFSSATGRALPDRYIEGTCPRCGYADARGDQCDSCGNQLDPADLINPRSKIDGQPPVFRDSEHFFLDLPAFGERLAAWIATQDHWRPNVRNFSLKYVEELKPRAITRDIDWGVPIPLPEFAGKDDKRLYVWFEAVIGYLSASIEWARNAGTPEAWRDWWQSPDARHFYFMGKDNIVFHTVMWPSILLGYGGLGLPYNVVSTEFLTMEGQKFSSSRGVAIYVNDFLERYDPDSLRFFLTVAGPETNDTDFTWEEFVRRNNGELVATWGNLVHRTLTNAYRNFRQVPEPGALTAVDDVLLGAIEGGFGVIGDHIEAARFKAALTEAIRLAAQVNQYLTVEEPWKKLKVDAPRAQTALYVALRCIDNLKLLLAPFLPFSSHRLHEMLGYDGVIAGSPVFREISEDGAAHSVLTGDYASWVGRWAPSALRPGQALREPKALFVKLDESVVADELARMGRASA